ncbi:hypothetical protein CHLRE_12g559700v5 [Chlamydomonas reinhardtii]|uniref:Uncharacterized protein n=1 Tax=Chlamydomonas reinhardtii TaxID=3055 RepID=A8JHM5_CHLRE|nr:uncharacterized protein CHLRE_12g559700v5 [Chlamydomonas reinhardtii]PNW75807.1 hypothetical protein CHLRE_12g559700v5 [Chlamydomonas reinhardtii]|eukprot:XP_001703139.1 predicted protein [Chlamydomonas reinhardtii]
MMLAKTRASIAPRARARIVVVRLGRVSILCRAWPWPGRDKPSAPSTSPPAADVTMVLTVVGSCLTLFSALYMVLAGLKAEISSDMTDLKTELRSDMTDFKKELRADLRQAEDRWYTVSRDTATLKAVSDARTPPPPPSPKQEKQPDQQQQ